MGIGKSGFCWHPSAPRAPGHRDRRLLNQRKLGICRGTNLEKGGRGKGERAKKRWTDGPREGAPRACQTVPGHRAAFWCYGAGLRREQEGAARSSREQQGAAQGPAARTSISAAVKRERTRETGRWEAGGAVRTADRRLLDSAALWPSPTRQAVLVSFSDAPCLASRIRPSPAPGRPGSLPN